MRFEMWKSKAQKGAFLVLIAVLIPVFLLLGSLALDLGVTWMHHSRLQNAADAAVLAGAYTYTSDTDRTNVKSHVRNQIEAYLNSNLYPESYLPLNEDSIQYRFLNGDSSSGDLLISLYVDQEFHSSLAKLAGVKSLPIHAHSTAKVVMSQKKAESVFDYAFIGGRSIDDDSPVDWEGHKSALSFVGNYVTIKGKVYSNGSIRLSDKTSGSHRCVLVDTSSGGAFSSSVTDENKIWESKHWDGTGNSIGIGTESSSIDVNVSGNKYYQSPIDISLSDTNPDTKSIYEFVEKYRKMYEGYGIVNRQIFIDTRGNYDSSYDPGSRFFNGSGWYWQGNVYPIIIVDGDINLTTNQYDPSIDHYVFISLHGNINITSIAGDKGTIRALVYAPNGNIHVNQLGKFQGSLVGKTIFTDTNNGTEFVWDDFGFNGHSSTGGGSSGADVNGKVSLYPMDPYPDGSYGNYKEI